MFTMNLFACYCHLDSRSRKKYVELKIPHSIAYVFTHVPTAPVPPPPPTPPTAHPPSQGVPPAPPPPIIGQPRPKVSPVSTGSQPTPGSARPSKVPSGPSMGDLLAGLADVKLRKPEDRALPGKHYSFCVENFSHYRRRCFDFHFALTWPFLHVVTFARYIPCSQGLQ